MRLIGRLSRRVLLTSVLTGVVAALLALGQARDGIGTVVGESIRASFDEGERHRCEADPSGWQARGPQDARVFAYDPVSLAPLHPDAPPLDAAFARDVLSGERELHSVRVGLGGQVVFRGAGTGPCRLLAATWRGPNGLANVQRVLLTTAVLSGLAGALMGLLLVVWPLARRTQRLRAAVEGLGATQWLQDKGGPDDDELDTAVHQLALADARIRRDAQTLLEQSSALQRHLGEVSHDVRTPLASLQLTLEHLADTTTEAATLEALAQALSECVAVSAITENLRLKSLVEDGLRPAQRPFDVTAVVERTVGRAQSLGRRKGVDVELAVPDAPLVVVGDEVFLERCVSNLLDNAVRYAEREGHVAVLVATRDDTFSITVRDDGPGVTPEALARLGERTFRTDEARQRDPRGSGLGLSITRALGQRCGWSLSFSALEPRGLEAILAGSTVPPRS